jgi:hypothetical protein
MAAKSFEFTLKCIICGHGRWLASAANGNLKGRPLLRLIFQDSVSLHALLKTMRFSIPDYFKAEKSKKDKNKGQNNWIKAV